MAAGVGREIRRSLRLALPLALLVALVNPLVYQGGETLLVRGGDVPRPPLSTSRSRRSPRALMTGCGSS